MATTQSAILWPSRFLPGTTDLFVSNEVIAQSLTAHAIWDQLVDMTRWETYYDNVSQLTPPPSGPRLTTVGSTFSFSTFGFPPLASRVEESTPPATGKPGRLAWRAWMEGEAEGSDNYIDVYHAWLIEDLEGGRVRILTQESQIGKPAVKLNGERPRPMLEKHQDWCEGLVQAARKEVGK